MAFYENNKDGLIYMKSDAIGTRHAFTTRFGGVSEGIFASLNLGSNRGDEPAAVRENYHRLTALFGADIDGCCVTQQVHKNDVRIVTSADKHVCMSKVPYEADGIVTGESGLPIICFTADCVPVLLWDEKKKAVAAVHCGWRSSVTDILKNTIEAMNSLGAENENVHAAIGPAIGACCFETDEDVPQAVEKYLSGETKGLFTLRADGKYLVDLRGANRRRLEQLGLKPENIDVSGECTFCRHDKYWSHRYTKGQRGSQASAIVLDR